MDKAYELHIEARRRTVANAAASLADFETTPVGSVDAQWLVQNPNVNLYSIDPDTSQAVFAEVPPEVNLAVAPFVWQAQYESAIRFFVMPLPQLVEVGKSLETKLERLILVFNIARCGSTLLHQVLNQVPGVVSLSEPDGFVPYSVATRLPADEVTALTKATAKFLFRPQAYPQMTVPAIKFRARNLALVELCHSVFPQATLLFLYRETIGWVASVMRFMQRVGIPLIEEKTPLDEIIASFSGNWGPISLDTLGLANFPGPLSSAQGYAVAWLMMMERYLRHVRAKLPITALSYTDLNQRREETLLRLFEVCGLPSDAVQSAIVAYERDSQAGTVMGREESGQGRRAPRLTTEQEEEIRALVRCHPLIQTTDFVAPGTIAISDT